MEFNVWCNRATTWIIWPCNQFQAILLDAGRSQTLNKYADLLGMGIYLRGNWDWSGSFDGCFLHLRGFEDTTKETYEASDYKLESSELSWESSGLCGPPFTGSFTCSFTYSFTYSFTISRQQTSSNSWLTTIRILMVPDGEGFYIYQEFMLLSELS